MNSFLNQLQVINDQVQSCTKCSLHKGRVQTVFARGNTSAKLMIIAEAPGENEEKLGLPLVGKSGILLDNVFNLIGYNSNTDSYIANIIKCRPPNNRKPLDEESNECFVYLDKQIELISPKIILALGNTAIYNLTLTTLGVSKLRGQFLKYKNIPVLCTWHPSYVLRNGSTGPIFEAFKNDIELAINKSRE